MRIWAAIRRLTRKGFAMIPWFRADAVPTPRLSDVRARLVALEHADARTRMETAMTIVHAQSILDLTARPTARGLDFRPGTSVWYREDVRLADGASRVVPAVFIAYRPRRGQCGIVRGVTDDSRTRPTWVSVDDVIRRHWADDATDPRRAWPGRRRWARRPTSGRRRPWSRSR